MAREFSGYQMKQRIIAALEILYYHGLLNEEKCDIILFLLNDILNKNYLLPQ